MLSYNDQLPCVFYRNEYLLGRKKLTQYNYPYARQFLYVFLDEAGDFGFHTNGSKYLCGCWRITWMFVGLFVIFCLGVFGVFEPDLKELHKQNQSRPRLEPKEELPVKMIMSGFGCEDRLLVLTLGTMKDDLKAAMWLRAEKEQGNCIEFKAGETLYVDGAPLNPR